MTGPWIDVSMPLHNGMVHWPGDAPFERTDTLRIRSGDVCNLSFLTTSVHTGTHMDAPRHFLEGAPGIDSLPIDATVGPARVIAIEDPDLIRVREIEPHRISSGERILFKTVNSRRPADSGSFDEKFVHIPYETAAYLAGRGVRTIGVDYLSVGGFDTDGPETHRELLSAGIWIIEGLDLRAIEPGNYELLCLPLKLMGADGAPARAVLRRL